MLVGGKPRQGEMKWFGLVSCRKHVRTGGGGNPACRLTAGPRCGFNA